jgi:hypothetical protein
MGRKNSRVGKQFYEGSYDKWRRTLDAVKKGLEENPPPAVRKEEETKPWLCLMSKLRPRNKSYDFPLLNEYMDTWNGQNLTARKAYEQYLALEVWKMAGEKVPRGPSFYPKYYQDKKRWQRFMEDNNYTDEDTCGTAATSGIDGQSLCERHATLHIDKRMIPEIERRVAEIRKNGLANDRKAKQVRSFQPHRQTPTKKNPPLPTAKKDPPKKDPNINDSPSTQTTSEKENMVNQVPLNLENVQAVWELMHQESIGFIEAVYRIAQNPRSENTSDALEKQWLKGFGVAKKDKYDRLDSERKAYLDRGRERAKKKYGSHK